MELLERIQRLCQAAGINPSTLEADLGFGKGTIYKWNKSVPSAGRLSKVADFFNVSVDFLLGRSGETEGDLDRNNIQFALYNEINQLSEENKKKVLDFARFLKEQNKKSKF